jgi:NADPH2 dehydrogenase
MSEPYPNKKVNDIAILELTSPIPLKFKPVRIYSYIDRPGKLVLLGYGDSVGKSSLNILNFKQVNIVDYLMESNEWVLSPAACGGDSGGPLIYQMNDEVMLLGITSRADKRDDRFGHVTEAYLSHYKRLASKGAGLLFVEYTYVHPYGKSEPKQMGIDSDDKVVGLKILVNSIKQYNLKVGIQLTHGGGKSSSEVSGVLIGADNIPVPVKDRFLKVPVKADYDDIKIIKDSFVLAAKRVVDAGFDLIEFHSAHGYALNQWLSPLTNKRNDRYGGSYENRSRILCKIISSVRNYYPDMLISVRIPGNDHVDGGLSFNDAKKLASDLEKLGVDIINVSSGIGGWRRPRDRKGEGYLVDDARVIKQSVKIPVIGVGGIKTMKYVNKALCNNDFDLAAIGRGFLNNEVNLKQVH